jgi:hypothetical protein
MGLYPLEDIEVMILQIAVILCMTLSIIYVAVLNAFFNDYTLFMYIVRLNRGMNTGVAL